MGLSSAAVCGVYTRLNSVLPLQHLRARATVQKSCMLVVAGLAVRVPLTNASITDVVFNVKKQVTAEEVNSKLQEASDTYLKSILQVCTFCFSEHRCPFQTSSTYPDLLSCCD
jgi:glyceraldehyde-3-phosphate dehydrogenase/erythrose-4-phosphate dehydrogenase